MTLRGSCNIFEASRLDILCAVHSCITHALFQFLPGLRSRSRKESEDFGILSRSRIFCPTLTSELDQFLHHTQGRNEVRWYQGQEASLAPPSSNLRSFGSKFTVLMRDLATSLGLFAPPAVIRHSQCHISYEARASGPLQTRVPKHESCHSTQLQPAYTLWFPPNVQCNMPGMTSQSETKSHNLCYRKEPHRTHERT